MCVQVWHLIERKFHIRASSSLYTQAQLTLIVLDASGSLGEEALRSLIGVGPFTSNSPPSELSDLVQVVERNPGLLLVVNKKDVLGGDEAKVRIMSLAKAEKQVLFRWMD